MCAAAGAAIPAASDGASDDEDDACEPEQQAPEHSDGVAQCGVSVGVPANPTGGRGALSTTAAGASLDALALARQDLRLMPGPPKRGLSRHITHVPQSSPGIAPVAGVICVAVAAFPAPEVGPEAGA